MDYLTGITGLLWIGGLAATPVALVVGAICRVRSVRPATRHMLWVAVLVSFLTPAIGTVIWRPDWFHSERVLAAADVVLDSAEKMAAKGTGDAESHGAMRTESAHGQSWGWKEVPVDLPPRAAVEVTIDPLPISTAMDATPIAATTLDVAPPVVIKPSMKPSRQADIAPAASLPRPVTGRWVPDARPAVRDSGPVGPSEMAVATPAPTPSDVPAELAEAAPDVLRETHAADSYEKVIEAPTHATPATASHGQPVSSDLTGMTELLLGLVEQADRSGLERRTSAFEAAMPGDEVVSATTRDAVEGSSAAWLAGVRAQIRPWISKLLDLRDSLASLPPVPAAIWASVAVLLVAVSISRTIRMGWWLRRGRPADAEVLEVVEQVAQQLGLNRVPAVMMVDGAVSPMIWCGLRTRLILPTDLWEAFDNASRRAVVAHELAHLRRLDHVFCWVETVVGALYWWHPAAWWARLRLRDAAEASCDAWVTALLPSDRRAYATALVTTKSFLSSQKPSAGPCLGIMSGSAKRLARRITMVMTQRTAPRTSIVGACLATIVVAAGMFVTPSLACPPEQAQKTKSADKHKARAALPPKAPEPGTAFYGEAPALEAMIGQPAPPAEHGVVFVHPEDGHVLVMPTTPVPPRPAQAPKAPRPPKAPKPPKGGWATGPGQAWTTAPTPSVQGQWSTPQDLESLKDGRVARTYKLSEGKLESFYSLMSRSDVPVLVSMQDDGIVIWAREEEHPFIQSFLKMIDSSAKPGGQHSLALPSDPVRLADLAVAGRAAGQAAKSAAQAELAARNAYGQQMAAHKEAMKAQSDALRSLLKDRERLMVDVDRMRAEADVARERADQLRELEEELHDRADEVSEEQAKAALLEAHGRLRERATALDRHTDDMDRRVEEIERRIEELEARAEELEDQLSALDEEEIDMLDADEIATIEVDVPEVEEIDVIEPADQDEGGAAVMGDDSSDEDVAPEAEGGSTSPNEC